MATLHETQPDSNEPLEFTHFDCWFEDETFYEVYEGGTK